MKTDIALVAALGLLVGAMIYLAVELEKTRRVLEPIATSPLVRALSA